MVLSGLCAIAAQLAVAGAHLSVAATGSAPAAAQSAELILAAQTPNATNSLAAPESFLDKLNRAVKLASQGECASALDILIPATTKLAYADLTPGSKDLVQSRIANCALKLQRWSDALNAINALLELRGDSTDLLTLKFDLGMFTDRFMDSLVAVERLADANPNTVSKIKLRRIYVLLRRLEHTLWGDLRLRLLDALWKAHYSPPDPTQSLDGLRMTYARLLRDSGMTARAAALIGEVSDPTYLAETLFDRRYEPLQSFKEMPRLEDLPAAVDRYLKEMESIAATQPNRLNATLNYMQALRMAGKFQAAADEGAAAAARMGENADASPYTDFDEYANWVLNEWGYALYNLGRNDEARAAMKRAAGLDEDGVSNVSQTINASSLLISEGKFDEALAAISGLEAENTSPYGKMWAKSVVVCAKAFQNRLGDDDRDLAYMKDHEADNEAALARTLLCANDTAGAVALYVKRLDVLDLRLDALEALQITMDPPQRLPVDAELARRFDAVRENDEVRAAAEKVGTILTLPFYAIYWGDL